MYLFTNFDGLLYFGVRYWPGQTFAISSQPIVHAIFFSQNFF